jgi:hypothetical protein
LCSKFEEALADFRAQQLDLEGGMSAENSRPLNTSLAISATTNSSTIGGETISVRTSWTIRCAKALPTCFLELYEMELTSKQCSCPA